MKIETISINKILLPIEIVNKILYLTGSKCHTCQLPLNHKFLMKIGKRIYFCSKECFLCI